VERSPVRDNGPYRDMAHARAQFVAVTQEFLSDGFPLGASQLVLYGALEIAGVKCTGFETEQLIALARHLDPHEIQVVAGWIVRARLAALHSGWHAGNARHRGPCPRWSTRSRRRRRDAPPGRSAPAAFRRPRVEYVVRRPRLAMTGSTTGMLGVAVPQCQGSRAGLWSRSAPRGSYSLRQRAVVGECGRPERAWGQHSRRPGETGLRRQPL